MLGFTAFSETPISQSTSSLLARAFLTSSIGQSTAGSLLFDAQGSFIVPSVSAVSANAILFDAEAAATVASILSNANINDIVSKGVANTTQSSVTATLTANTVDSLADANITFNGVNAAATPNNFFDVDAKANFTVTGSSSSAIVQDVLYNLTANIIQPAVTASFNTGILDYTLTANITPTGAFATSNASDFGDVFAKANITPTGSSSSAVVQDVLYNLTANIIQPAVTAFFNTGTLDYRLTANITPTGAFATSTASDFGGVDAKANITTVGTSSNTAVNDFADVTGLANVTPSSATAFLSIYIGNFADEDAQATAFIPPAVGTASIKDVDFSADSLITTGSTSALLNVSTLDALGGAKATFSGTLANLYNNLLDTTVVKFPYADYADQYNRANTLYIVSYEGSKKVHVVSEDRTVYTESKQDNNIVYITEENYTVYIGKQQGSNTVYIAA